MSESIQFSISEQQQAKELQSLERWQALNNAHLAALVDWALKLLSDEDSTTSSESVSSINARFRSETKAGNPSSINVLNDQFGLNESDQSVLALVVAAALEPLVAERCAVLSGNHSNPFPTAILCVSRIPECDWSSFSPHSPLRYWLLVEWQPLGSGDGVLSADERVVNFARGLSYIDERLSVLLEPANSESAASLMPSQRQQLDAALNYLSQSQRFEMNNTSTVFELFGDDAFAKRTMAVSISTELNIGLQRINAANLPTRANDLDALARLWLREASLLPMLLLVEEADDAPKQKLAAQFVERLRGLVLIETGHASAALSSRSFPLEVKRPSVQEQESIWAELLPVDKKQLPARLAEQFSMSEPDIFRSASVAAAQSGSDSDSEFEKALWQICQRGASTELSKLAQRIECKASWNNLVLPESQTKMLEQLASQVALRSRVYQSWGFRERMSRGMGISAMFSGESGTGKTMAAEVIANTLNLDLYRIDLASVISKYIGESEKQMRALFQAAERCGAILFFDEADALFGKRSEVKNSNDRFANIGIDDLLQRIEMFNGLAILATNLKSQIDKAFMRRLRFVVDFPFPAPAERERIWRSVFPTQTPLASDVNPARLARLNLTGGSIHNVALNGAFLAAQHNESVSMRWLMEAAAAELQKLERPIKAGDLDYG
ncbi:ATP-dependent zinc metalloprotease FtsH [Grimontia celer]|uniref:ATP-dependent zinc metalloprotease FtsH n=1 Tax=Grimontia celer TaxID=1796497 RepID=A0A128F4L6_9GAMM|nr:ATP-binding protein [Grimontia celer]CZF81727.1 ATP-dependent zinc metalloprotease FtsH [Grimontia celer]